MATSDFLTAHFGGYFFRAMSRNYEECIVKSLLTIKEFAEKFSISRSQVYRILERQEIPLIKIGRAARIRVSDADAWLENLCQTQK